MTGTHENCTHPKTKAARSACRKINKGAAPAAKVTPERKLAEGAGIVKPLPAEIQTPIAEPKIVTAIKFTQTECSRCYGSGSHGPSSVKGGVCFGCSGQKMVLTKSAQTARKIYDALVQERMGVSVHTLKPGDIILCTAQTYAGYTPVEYKLMWRKIKTITVDTETRGSGTVITDAAGNRTTIWHHSVSIEFESTAGERKWAMSMMPESLNHLMFPLYNKETLYTIFGEMVARFPKSVTDASK